ncbi:A disintegrin and metalloproteinase with thrombospondin motifs 2-like [Actinia tenebrosa]|uniref:A disintegrin and metalloproteinase with thrombospondin motifs 2-like n=1 Tax=Actinia tenebrosa TaxID=6105 RepID=A0A6P8J2C0_ACTTE|nr:A disintegrin and metalloproteinase with thrombospondin motifs 2-like [Actinia tenebrosa]
MVHQDFIVYFSFVVFLLITSFPFLNTAKAKWKAQTPILHQEHLLRNLPDCEIGYPTETNQDGRYIRHVTSPDHQRRKRRSIDRTDTPIYYNITYRGTTYSAKLRLNEELLSSGFVVETHKKGGRVEKTRLVDNCYLIGETSVYNLSVALSDCDGLSGAIDTGDDVLFIEPIINETAVKSKHQGKPHLLYTKSSLQKIDQVAFDMMGDNWKPNYASAKSAKGSTEKFIFQAARSFIRIVNQADRPVKIIYLDGKEEKLFAVLQVDGEQSINTFTSHRWLARDSISDKKLFIDGKKLYIPRVNLEYDRKTIYVTIPSMIRKSTIQK